MKMQYSRLKKLLKISKDNGGHEEIVSLPASVFTEILMAAIKASPVFDEVFYLKMRPDVVDAIKGGTIRSAVEHYARTGYFEGTMPSKIAIDEAYYLANNTDVAAAFRKRQIKNPQQHFEGQGYIEGRLPLKGFSIWEIL